MTTLMSFTQWFNIGSKNDATLDVMSGLYHLLGRVRHGVENFTLIYNQTYDKRS